MPTLETTANQTTQIQREAPDFGSGRYSALMLECYNDAKTVFKLDDTKAEKLARQIASDFGAVMASAPVETRLGKQNKDGKITLSEAAKVKGVTITNALFAMKALRFAGDAGVNGFSFGQTAWKPVKSLAEYLNSL